MVSALAVEMVGRETELLELEQFVARACAEPATLLVEGEPGIGKTMLWRRGVAAALERQVRVLQARPTEAESSLSFASLGDLLEPVVDRLEELAPARRRALRAALLLGPEPPAWPGARGVGVALLDLVRLLAAERPLLVAVDDLQWLDAPSAAAIAFVVRRLASEPVGLLASVRVDGTRVEPLGLDRALGQQVGRLRLGPLGREETARLLHARLAGPQPRHAVGRIHERSGGNPFLALELARAQVEGRGDRLPASLRALVAGRVARLADDVRAVLAVLAASAQPDVALVRAIGGNDALRVAEQDGIVVVDGHRIRFAHPLLAAAAHETTPSEQLREAHRTLAALAEEPEQRARHLALAAEGPDEVVATALDAAAAAALRRGAPGAAAELAEQALALTLPGDTAALRRRRLEAARRNDTLGATSRQRELLEEVLASAVSAHDRAEPLWQLATIAWQEGDDLASARATIDEALLCVGGDDALRAEILIATWWVDHVQFGSRERAIIAHEHAERSGDARLRSITLGWVATTTFSSGLGLDRGLFEQAMELEARAGFVTARHRPTTQYGWAATWAGDVALGRTLLERSAADALDVDDAAGAAPLFYLAELHHLAGEWERALERAEESRQLAADAGRTHDAHMALLARAVVEAHQGRLEQARAHIEEAHAAETIPMGWPYRAYARAMVSLAESDAARTAELLAIASAGLLESGVVEPALHVWFALHADALVQLGRLDEAVEVVAGVEERASRLDRRWALAMCRHLHGTIAAARGDAAGALAELEHALELHDGVGRPLDRAWTLVAYGQALRRARRRRSARDALEEGVAELDRLGARPWADRARAELRRIGGRASGGSQLTPTEERVAALVTAGRSNREVAAELFVTVRTVEKTLSRVYAKLGVRSRTQLAGVLRPR